MVLRENGKSRMSPFSAPSVTAFYRSKQATARFFAERILPQAAALLGPVTSGAETLAALDDGP